MENFELLKTLPDSCDNYSHTSTAVQFRTSDRREAGFFSVFNNGNFTLGVALQIVLLMRLPSSPSGDFPGSLTSKRDVKARNS